MKFVLEIDLSKDIYEFGETQNDALARILRLQAEIISGVPNDKTALGAITDTKGENAGFWRIKN